MTNAEWTLALAYAAWLAASVLRQPRWAVRRWVTRWDECRLAPPWSLFDNPTRNDFTFACRVRDANGAWTDWSRIDLVPARPRWSWLWHPQLFVANAVIDCANFSWSASDAAARAEFQGSDLFTAMTSVMAARAGAPDATAIQVLIRAARAFDPDCKTVPVFLSDVLPLTGPLHVVR
jgi:hypothetical protein